MNSKQLFEKILEKRSFLCVGLDTDLKLIPQSLMGEEFPLFSFNKAIVDATAPYAVAYKPNLAFYEAYGSKGIRQFEMTVEYIKKNYPDILVIADAKRGDIGNTAARYAESFFNAYDCDAVTLSPYMGKDSVEPFLGKEGKWAVVLALTSNKSADDFEQLELANAKPLYRQVIETACTWGDVDNLMFVVGATRPEKLKEIRDFCPEHFFLVPGVGAQGGTVEEVAQAGMNAHCGLLVNSSRGIIYASKDDDFASAAAAAARKMQEKMDQALKKIS